MKQSFVKRRLWTLKPSSKDSRKKIDVDGRGRENGSGNEEKGIARMTEESRRQPVEKFLKHHLETLPPNGDEREDDPETVAWREVMEIEADRGLLRERNSQRG